MPAGDVPQIDYAPPPPPARRMLRRAARPLLLLVLAAVVYWCAPGLIRFGSVYLAYRPCASYSAPPGRVVFSDDPAELTALLADPAYQRVSPGPNQLVGAAYVPPAWPRFYALVSPPGLWSAGTVFLHELKTPEGNRMLVAVDFRLGGWRNTDDVPNVQPAFHVRTFTPALPYRLPAERQSSKEIVGMRALREAQPAGVRLFAGQPDPADPSHFTIPYEIDGARGVIDGWLRNSGAVDLELRNQTPSSTPPAARPAPGGP